MFRFPSAPRQQPKHRLCTSLQTADNRGNTARGASIPTKPAENMPLPLSTISSATATRPQELSQPPIVKFFQKPPWMMQNMYSPTKAPVVAQQRARPQPSAESSSSQKMSMSEPNKYHLPGTAPDLHLLWSCSSIQRSPPPADPASVAQEPPESVSWARRRQAAPRSSAGSVPEDPAARPGWPATSPFRRLPSRTAGRTPGEEGASVAVARPGPGILQTS